MKIGFIGAGNVGFSLSKWINLKHHNVCGIYSKNVSDAKLAADFSISEYYSDIKDIVYACDTLFLTVNDDSIIDVVDELSNLNLKNKILIHTSGSYTSDIFQKLNIDNYCISIHPLYAFNDKYNSYKNLDDIYFTIEGNLKYINELQELFNNKLVIINKENKEKYHLASSIISNMVCSLVYMAEEIYKSIGIMNKDIYMPLLLNNISNIKNNGPIEALTGPILRLDLNTVKKHLNNLNGNDLLIYKSLGLKIIEMSEKKTSKNYNEMKKLLEV